MRSTHIVSAIVKVDMLWVSLLCNDYVSRRVWNPVWCVLPRQLRHVPTALLVPVSTGQVDVEQSFLSLRSRWIASVDFKSQPVLV